jgi:hypothetical protein
MVGAIAVLAAPVARGGGVPVELAPVGSTIWTISNAGLVAVDARTGAVRARPLTPYPYAIAVAAGEGAVWVASVENGFVSGAVTRIDAQTGRKVTRLRLPHGAVYGVCAAGDSAWAITGPSSRRRVVRVDARGGRSRFVATRRQPAWCAADAAGVWFTTGEGRLVRVDPRTNGATELTRVRGLGQIAAGGGAVWGALHASVVRIDERTGAVRPTRVGASVYAVAAGAHVWALADGGAGATRLVRIDPATGRVDGRRKLRGSMTSVVETRDALWIGGYERRRDSVLLRLDPRSLTVKRVVTLL